MTWRTSSRHFLVLLLIGSYAAAQNPGGTSVGLKPLTELATALYKGYPGGLYPDGLNFPPARHDSAGRAFGRLILPLAQSGGADPTNGRIVLLSIGMSNTTQEFSAFKQIADADAAKNPRLVIVDGAQGGQTAAIITNPAASFWTVVDQRLQNSGVTRQQVQAVWLKEADAGPATGFPVYARTLAGELESICRLIRSLYPNLRIVYLSSRIYAGYATSTLNPEPYAYESGFSVKWLIEKQINGDTSLAYSPPKERAPLLLWGPYLWADGLIPRNDGLTWKASDFQSDGTHPGPDGQKKVAGLLLSFFKTDPTAVTWFLKPGATATERTEEASPRTWSLEQNYPNPFNPETSIRLQLAEISSVSLEIYNVLGIEVAVLVREVLAAGSHIFQWNAIGQGSGVYYYRLSLSSPLVSGGPVRTETRRMILLR